MNLDGNKEFTEQNEIDKMISQSICHKADAFFISSGKILISSPGASFEGYPR